MVQNPGTNVPGFFHFKKRIAVPKEARYCLAVWLKLIMLTCLAWGARLWPPRRGCGARVLHCLNGVA